MLDGKVAIITGAGRGIGRAIASGFAQHGAAVTCAARTHHEIESLAAEIKASGGQARAVPTDVTDWPAVQTMTTTTVETFGRLDVLVINAGVNLDRRTVADSQPEDWIATLQINLTGAYYCAKAAISHLKTSGGGHILVIGSGMGHRATPGRSAYAASKAGLWMFTRALAEELRQDRICVNELIPGPVVTGMPSAPSPANDPLQPEWFKPPEAVVPLALFLVTQPLTGPTGQSFSLMRRDSQ